MIDKKLEQDIKALNGFLEFWVKFHSIYNNIISRELITNEDETKFLDTKELVKNKYGELRSSLDLKYVPHGRLTDPVDDVLSINGVRLMSENGMRKLNDDWQDSYIFLNSILERLKNNKKRLEEFNPVGVFLKRLFRR